MCKIQHESHVKHSCIIIKPPSKCQNIRSSCEAISVTACLLKGHRVKVLPFPRQLKLKSTVKKLYCEEEELTVEILLPL